MSLMLEEAGRNSTGTFRIHNTNNTPLTIELYATRRLLEDGYYDTTEPADEDFLLMPPQAYIEPGQVQVFRIRYMGENQLSQSVGYRVVFHQLPLNILPTEALDENRIEILVNIHAPVYVSPIGAQPALELSLNFYELTDVENFFTNDIDPKNESGVLIIYNRGDGLQDLSNGVFRFHFEGGETEELTWVDVSPAVYVRHILPGGESKIPLEHVSKVQGRRVTNVEFVDRN
ncbi:MAG: molecular chaperone [Idiomarina sp.]|nr:molecular chaperone [Idiomarina sp.]